MEIPPDPIITMDDVRKAGFCAGIKTKRWFIDHGFDFQSFIRNGVSAAEFLEKGDALAQRVVAAKQSRSNG